MCLGAHFATSYLLPGGQPPGALENRILFELASDVDYIVFSNAGGVRPTKEAMTICTAQFKAFSENNVPDLGVQFHTITPLQVMREAVAVELVRLTRNVWCLHI